MIQKIRVKTIIGPDLRGQAVLSDIHHMHGLNSVQSVQAIKVYRLEGITKKQAKILAEKLLSESVNQTYTINKPVSNGRVKNLEIAYKGGVMNPEIASIMKASKDLGIHPKACDSSWEYIFDGKLKDGQLPILAEKLNLFNKTVEHVVEEEPATLLIKGQIGETKTIPITGMSDMEMLKVSQDSLFLNLEEMQTIQAYFRKLKRNPTDCELETIAQTWSEHCAHKTFKATLMVDGKRKAPLIERIKEEALKHNKNIVSAFVDNSGVMDFYEGFAICGKAETHNSPSAIEPYGGAMTGSGGVFRDVVGTGQGAKAIVSTDMFCFAPYDMALSKLPEGCLPPEYLLKRCVQAVRDYGNRIGIPTNNGSFHFHEDFRAKPTVLVGSYGILPKKWAQKGKPRIGDLAVAIGGRTGRDGIHGATFSSGEMTERTISLNAQAVQIGNAIEEKRMFDAILEARDEGLIRAIQDCGAGGFSSSVGEMAEKVGVTVHLEKVPLKYQGLAPWEIWLSESQERMMVVIPQNKLKKFLKVCKRYNVETAILGKFDGSKKLKVTFGREVVCDLDMQFLHHGLPKRVLNAKRRVQGTGYRVQVPKSPKTEKEWVKVLEKVLAHGNICSKEPIVRLYDHSVQGTNDLQPYSGVIGDGPNDAVVIRPFLNKSYGLVVSHGLNPVLNKIDPYWGSIWSCAEALSNYVAVGGNYKDASLINNYIAPFPDEETLWALDRCVDAVCDFMKVIKLPVISGKDSLSSTYRGADGTVIKIPTTLCMSVFGKIPDASKTITSDFKKVGSVICLVGRLDIKSMGGSTYFNVGGMLGNSIPKVDLKLLPKIFGAIFDGIQKGGILSCHDISEGGLITTIFEMCVGGNYGVMVNVNTRDREDCLLFNETGGCFVVEVENESVAKKIFKNTPYKILGQTIEEATITVKNRNKNLFTEELNPLKKAWQKPMEEIFL